MKKKKTFDMLNGSIWNKLILFALPLAASSILQQLFNAADVAVVGSFAGSGECSDFYHADPDSISVFILE